MRHSRTQAKLNGVGSSLNFCSDVLGTNGLTESETYELTTASPLDQLAHYPRNPDVDTVDSAQRQVVK